ncbi:50S ribosomal protein L18 [Candidatus Woesearchaeota archaeon]|nr:50S ribosomal protein L18 [Candidatus Woesearchaeota archaeon]
MKNMIAVQFRRKRSQATDYRKRFRLLSAGVERLVVRKTSSQIIVQLAKFVKDGDRVVVSQTSNLLRQFGWAHGLKNTPAAYLTGYLAGKQALAKGLKSAILDAGSAKPHGGGRVYAALKGAVDAGLSVPCSQDIFPSDERLSGRHISDEVAASFSLVKGKIAGGKK